MPDIPYKYLKESDQVFYPVIGPSSINGEVPVASGGTGAATPSAARENLGAISAEDAIMGSQPSAFVLNIEDGGTSATTPSGACANLGAIPSILNSDYYGNALPSAGTPGRIFFLKVE